MALQKFFHIFKDPEETDTYFVFVDDFYNYFKEESKEKSCMRRSYFLRGLKNIKFIEGKEVVSLQDVLKYCFNHYDTHKGCEKIVKIVENLILYGKGVNTNEYVRSSFELYSAIAKTSLSNIGEGLRNFHIDESKISTLVAEHRNSFPEEEWRKIILFEYHFAKENVEDSTYEELMKIKWKKFQLIMSVNSVSEELGNVSKKHITERFIRQETAKKVYSIQINGSKTHLAEALDLQLYSTIQEYFTDAFGSVTVVGNDSVEHDNKVSIIIEVQVGQDEEMYSNVCISLQHEIEKRHGLQLTTVLFVSTALLTQYKTKDGCIARFHFRDDWNLGYVSNYVYLWENQDSFVSPDILDQSLHMADSDGQCKSCFSDSLPKPLSMKTFDILQEWFLEVPMEIQLIFSAFLNRRQLKRSQDPNSYLKQKVERLYMAYDVLLNVLNKNHIGVLQQSNTNELLQDYKSVKAVFSITSASGTTTSLTKAETSWKEKTDDDLLYYNTFLKPQPLTYSTAAGIQTNYLCMRQCHVILMLDNLVRLKYGNDPERSERESKQLCTIPITLQGLPKDNSITEHWHDSDICDNTPTCMCKRKILLHQDDMKKTLLEQSAAEKSTYNQFVSLYTWGHRELWHKMTDELSQLLEDEEVETSEEIAEICQQYLDQAGPHEQQDTAIKDSYTEDAEDDSVNHLLQTVDTSHMLNDDDSCDVVPRELEDSMDTSFDKDVSGLAESLLDMSIVEERDESIINVVGSFGLNKFTVPPLLCRHPPPATGRDDDEAKIKEILDDILLKLGYLTSEERRANRILCGPDNKIGSCLLKLMSSNEKYHLFLSEFPLLHLRKSMITILFSSYQAAGLVHLLKYMRDDDQENWSRLISTHHIDAATRNVKRLGQAINLAFLVTFAKHLPATECEIFLNDMNSLEPTAISTKWSGHFQRFLDEGSERNATFALHKDIMMHCIDISAVSIAERLGGPQGYQLLLAAVKSSVTFSFVNGASSYGPYCVQLLYQHYSAGHFHQKLKETLYTTPFGNSTKNFACDTKREMDHLDALKGFRTGSTLSSVTSRMSLIDSLNEASRRRTDINNTNMDDTENVTWSVSEVDMGHIHPTAALILRRKALSLEENHIPFNVYSKEPTSLPASILDSNSTSVAEYLIKRFCVKENLFGFKESDRHQDHEITGPSDLVQRAKQSKGTTLKRTLKSKVTVLKTEKQESEEKRKKLVARKAKEIDSLTSQVNACQAFLKPDSSKPKVFKSLGMQRAIQEQVQNCLQSLQITESGFSTKIGDYLQLGIQHIPAVFATNTKFATMEFAGVKFKTAHCTSGSLYLHFCETLITKSLREFPNVTELIICEEKYSYTPDDFKQATRSQRQSKVTNTIDHLKTTTSVLSDTAYNKDFLTKTDEGKSLISKYLADNISKLSIQKTVQLSVDSELIQESCECLQACSCTTAAIPVMKRFYENQLPSDLIKRNDIKQRKGEAEMSQVDWLIQNAHNLHPGEAAVSILTSGDIDALYIHLFALSRHWPRDENGAFPSAVYVVLQKPGSKYDVYNVTLILELLEKIYDDKDIGVKVAIGLCIGGNDYVPKMQQLSHTTILKHVLKPKYRNTFIACEDESISVNKACLVYSIKDLYCPKRFDPGTLSFDQVRALTIGKKTVASVSGHTTKDPKKWLPPESALHRFADIVQLQIDYLITAGFHEKELPDFLSKGCLVKRDGCIEYDFGPDAHFSSTDSLPVVSQSETVSKRVNENTPQAGARRKRPLTSTPLKNSTWQNS